MKILLINQFFWPDSAATSQLLTDVARVLQQRGHEVRVLCNASSYAEADWSNAPDVEINRFRSLPFGRAKLGRLLSYASYLTAAGFAGISGDKPDIVVTLTTPPLVSLLGTLIHFVRGSRHYSWEMDLYPDIVSDLGYLQSSNPMMRLVGTLADFSRHRSNGVIALGECMKRRLIARGIPESKIHVAENWADGDAIRPEPFRNDGKLKLLYSGNLGLGHDVETFCAALRQLTEAGEDSCFHLKIAGGGSRHAPVRAFCAEQKITNVDFTTYCKRDELGHSLAAGDIGLVTQQANCSGSIVPSKLYGILAAGRPVLYIGPRDSTPAQVILRSQCGWVVDCGDAAALTTLLRHLANHREEIFAAGERARRVFDENYDAPTGTNRIYSVIFGEAEAPQLTVEPAGTNPQPRGSLDRMVLTADKKP